VTPQRHSVKVTLGGIELSISSEHSPEYTREVAAYFDAVLARFKNAGPTIDAHRAALLAGLAITDELFQARAKDRTAIDPVRLRAVRDRLARLVPAAKGGTGKAKGA
jgi:cell division protein ZapA (FtsZ GTPase activity inhibitor)